MAKKEDKQQMYIYAGMPVPELMLRKGKIYNTIPNLPEEFKFLKEYFVPIEDYPKTKLKLNKEETYKQLFKEVREALKTYKKKQEVK